MKKLRMEKSKQLIEGHCPVSDSCCLLQRGIPADGGRQIAQQCLSPRAAPGCQPTACFSDIRVPKKDTTHISTGGDNTYREKTEQVQL